MPVANNYFDNKKSGGDKSARCVLYRGNNNEDIKQFDSFETITKKLLARLGKQEVKVKNLEKVA